MVGMVIQTCRWKMKVEGGEEGEEEGGEEGKGEAKAKGEG